MIDTKNTSISEWLVCKKFYSRSRYGTKYNYEVKVIATYFVPDQVSLDRLKANNNKKHKTIEVDRSGYNTIMVDITSQHFCKTLEDVKKLAGMYKVPISRNVMNNQWQGEFYNKNRR